MKDNRLYYLATPYSHELPEVRHKRFVQAAKITGDLLIAGYKVISPISHSHPVAEQISSQPHELWMSLDMTLISKCDSIIMCQLIDGWEKSRGMKLELEHALKRSAFPVKVVYYDSFTSKVFLVDADVAYLCYWYNISFPITKRD